MLSRILEEKKDAIARRWLELSTEAYPPETTGFLQREKDPFANPAGHLYRVAAPILAGALGQEELDRETLRILDDLMRIRSLQDFTAGEAVGVILLLRQAVLELSSSGQTGSEDMLPELLRKTDRLVMAAVDAFVACRERMYQARLHERERHQASLLKRVLKASNAPGEMHPQHTPGSARKDRPLQ